MKKIIAAAFVFMSFASAPAVAGSTVHHRTGPATIVEADSWKC
jgi:hypothetical protein